MCKIVLMEIQLNFHYRHMQSLVHIHYSEIIVFKFAIILEPENSCNTHLISVQILYSLKFNKRSFKLLNILVILFTVKTDLHEV